MLAAENILVKSAVVSQLPPHRNWYSETHIPQQ